MVRGCQKKIIYLKSTGSEVFDEAFFVVSERTPKDNFEECDMVEEANRILDECITSGEKRGKFTVLKEFIKEKTAPFFMGLVIGVLITLLIK